MTTNHVTLKRDHVNFGTNQPSNHYHPFSENMLPRAPMTSSFEGQPPQNKAFSNQNKGHVGSR